MPTFSIKYWMTLLSLTMRAGSVMPRPRSPEGQARQGPSTRLRFSAFILKFGVNLQSVQNLKIGWKAVWVQLPVFLCLSGDCGHVLQQELKGYPVGLLQLTQRSFHLPTQTEVKNSGNSGNRTLPKSSLPGVALLSVMSGMRSFTTDQQISGSFSSLHKWVRNIFVSAFHLKNSLTSPVNTCTFVLFSTAAQFPSSTAYLRVCIFAWLPFCL